MRSLSRPRSILLAALLLTVAPATAGAITASQLRAMGGRPCTPGSSFTCVTLTVPLDHFDAANTGTTKVVFAIHPAGAGSKGLYVTATGGPGSNGVDEADDAFDAYSAAIRARFDFVFFDQRGLGRSGGLTCPNALWNADDVTKTVNIGPASTAYVTACVAELPSTRLLPYVGTTQAVEDLEALRLAVGGPSIWLYGESYGTQYVQTYAAAHPAAIKGAIIDGVVDLTLSGIDFLRSSATAFERDLNETLTRCNRWRRCRADVGGSAGAAYDALLARLRRAPGTAELRQANGKTTTRVLTADQLQGAVYSELYTPEGRMQVLRALAAATHGDLAPFVKLSDADGGIWMDASYLAIDCNDYGYFSGTLAERKRAFLAAAATAGVDFPRLGPVGFIGEYPCLDWPTPEPSLERPAGLANAGIPTLVLTATGDPITPVEQARAVYSRLADGYLITTRGGPHVTYGNGECPDTIVDAFLTSDRRPTKRETFCSDELVRAYQPIARPTSQAYGSLRAALRSVQAQIDSSPEYAAWADPSPIAFGCGASGSIRATWDGTREHYTFRNCAFTPGVALAGTGLRNGERFTMTVQVSGHWQGSYLYVNHGGTITLTS